MKRQLLVVLIYSGFVLMFLSGQGQASVWSADFLRLEVSAGSAAQAAGAAANGGSDHMFWNPAGITGQFYPSFSLTHFSSFADTAYEQAEGIYPNMFGGHWGFKLFYAKTYDFYETDDSGQTVGAIDNADVLLQFTHARLIGGGLTAGLGVKGFNSALAGYNRLGFAADAGLRFQPDDWPLAFGAAIHNIGTMGAYDATSENLPTIFIGGVGLIFSPFEGHRVQLLTDYTIPLEAKDEAYPSFGLVYQATSFVVLRGGYRLDQLTLGYMSFGGGLRLGNFGLDYAYQPFDGLGDNHRFTLSYHFLPSDDNDRRIGKNEPNNREVSFRGTAKREPAFQSQSRMLKVEPRKMEGRFEFKPPKMKPTIRGWTFEVRDAEGNLVRKVSSVKPPPRSIVWEGKDQSGNYVPRMDKYRFVFTAGNQAVEAPILPQVEPVIRLFFAGGAKVAPESRWIFKDPPDLEKWKLIIRERSKRKSIRTIKGKGPLPLDIRWDGRDKKKRIAATNRRYAYELILTYPNGAVLTFSEIIKSVPARTFKSKKGTKGVLIYGILYDFRKSVLKPRMASKVLAAAEWLRNHPKGYAVCEGNTDKVGSKWYNIGLSYRRARSVAVLLGSQKGIPQRQIRVVGHGEKKLISKGRSEKAKAQNRRVEIRLYLPQ